MPFPRFKSDIGGKINASQGNDRNEYGRVGNTGCARWCHCFKPYDARRRTGTILLLDHPERPQSNAAPVPSSRGSLRISPSSATKKHKEQRSRSRQRHRPLREAVPLFRSTIHHKKSRHRYTVGFLTWEKRVFYAKLQNKHIGISCSSAGASLDAFVTLPTAESLSTLLRVALSAEPSSVSHKRV